MEERRCNMGEEEEEVEEVEEAKEEEEEMKHKDGMGKRKKIVIINI